MKIMKTIIKMWLAAAILFSFTVTAQAQSGQTNDVSKLFPYDRQQFANQRVYLDGTEATENMLYYIYAKVCEMLNGSADYSRGASTGALILLTVDNKALPYGEPVVNAFFYEYFQRPDDYKNFRQMLKGYIVAQSYYFHRLNQKLAEGSDTQAVDAEGKKYDLFEPESKRIERGYSLMKAAESLAGQSDYQNIFDGTYSCLTQADKAYNNGQAASAVNNYREFFTAWDNFLTQHPQWRNDDRAGQFTQMHDQAKVRERQLSQKLSEDLMESKSMPKTYGAIPGLESKIRSILATEDPEHKNAPIVFLSNGWRNMKSNGVITNRAVDVGWTYKDSKGQKWLAYTTLMQKAVYKGTNVVFVEGAYGFSGGYKTMKLK